MPLMEKACIFVDDIGREYESISDYGTKRYPMIEWILAREHYSVPFFSTTNKTDVELAKLYGKAAFDRLQSWTRFVQITGDSKR